MLARSQLPRLTDRLPLGAAGLEVSPICVGMSLDADVIPAAFEAGINFFFLSSDLHWPLYRETRRGLEALLRDKPGARDQIVVAVTSYVSQLEFLWAPFDEVRMELPELGHVDVTIAGGCYAPDFAARLPVFEKHREVRYLGTRAIGASFHDRKAALAAVGAGVIDLALVRYNPQHPRAEHEVFEHVTSRDAGRRTLLYNFKSTVGHVATEDEYAALGIGAGFWRPHITDYYRFALTAAALDGLLVGLPAAGAVRELADALAKGPLDDEDRQYLIDLGDLQRGRAKVAS
jgi:hypothetical protein